MKHEIIMSDKFGIHDMMEMAHENEEAGIPLFEKASMNASGDNIQRILGLVAGLDVGDKKAYMESETHQYLISECDEKRLALPVALGILEAEIVRGDDFSMAEIHELIESQAKFLEHERDRLTSPVYIESFKDALLTDEDEQRIIRETFSEYVRCNVPIPKELMEFVMINSNESGYFVENFKEYVE